MINSSSAFQEAVSRDSRTFKAVFFYNGSEVTGEIRKLAVYKGSCGASDFIPGTVFCPHIEVIMDHCAEILEGKELELKAGVMINDDLSEPEYDYIRMGYFTVGKPLTSAYRTSFMAQGRIGSRLTAYMENIPAVLTIGNIADQIEADTGVAINVDDGIDVSAPVSSAFIVKALSPGLTFRDALAAITAAAGGYATETADGEIRICRFRTGVTAEYSADYMTEPPAFHDIDTVITGVKVVVVEGSGEDSGLSYTSGDPVNLELNCEYMSAAAFSTYATNLIGLTWRGGSVSLALGDPRIEPWDVLRITDSLGTVFVIPCMSLVHTYDGGFQTLIEAPSLPEAGQVEGTVTRVLRIVADAQAKAGEASEAVSDMQERMDSGEFKGEDASVLRIDSSRGTLFKNNAVSTVLTVAVYTGGERITNITDLRARYGAAAHLQWYWQKLDDSDFGIIVSSDHKLSEDGFSLTLTPDEVDTKVTFRCELVTG
ncbi:MAG: hypothetical protein IJJ38_04240 [Lachnospiraceae bacterium]|nr:hypothetical protein [Lachnospiraceae bacterium]